MALRLIYLVAIRIFRPIRRDTAVEEGASAGKATVHSFDQIRVSGIGSGLPLYRRKPG
jgi:hypothetical protein